jgi:hypothetical protein
MNVNTSNDFNTNPKETVVLDENSMESEDSSGEVYETGCNEIVRCMILFESFSILKRGCSIADRYNFMVYKTYAIEEDEEDFSEREYVENVENFSNITSTPVSEFVFTFLMFILEHVLL